MDYGVNSVANSAVVSAENSVVNSVVSCVVNYAANSVVDSMVDYVGNSVVGPDNPGNIDMPGIPGYSSFTRQSR